MYYGESSRSWWDRARDHCQALVTKNKDYAVVKHWICKHGDMDDPPNYEFKLESTHKSAIHRQITEAIRIDSEPEENLMNGKAEWGHNRVPRLKLPEDQVPQQQPLGSPQDDDAQTEHVRGKRRPERQQESDNFSMQYTQRAKRIRHEKKALRDTEFATNWPRVPSLDLKGKSTKRGQSNS